MLPIGDDNSDRRITPIINYLLVIANIVVFIFLQNMGHNDLFTYGYSTVPAEILTGHDIVTQSQVVSDPYTGAHMTMPGLQPSPYPVYLTLLTSMFMHAGIAHIAGNMLYLWIFGDNLENVMGHGRYLLFYLLCGVLASISHVAATAVFGQNELIPSLGASGAISGVLGGYVMLFPLRRVRVWFILGFWPVPAFLCLGLWIAYQVIDGMGAMGGTNVSNVAFAAHIGGFIAGFLLVRLFVHKELLVPKRRNFI